MITTIILLLTWHALADFPLQGDYLARMKDPFDRLTNDVLWDGPARNPLWPWHMGAHCMIHAGGVYVITASWQCAAFEFVCHWLIDWTKCHNRISFHVDQMLHIACKVVIVAYMVLR